MEIFTWLSWSCRYLIMIPSKWSWTTLSNRWGDSWQIVATWGICSTRSNRTCVSEIRKNGFLNRSNSLKKKKKISYLFFLSFVFSFKSFRQRSLPYYWMNSYRWLKIVNFVRERANFFDLFPSFIILTKKKHSRIHELRYPGYRECKFILIGTDTIG